MAGGKLKSGVKHKKNKGKKWKKGHSSESNPQIKKHRELVKSKFFNVNDGPSRLTVDALAKHNAVISENTDLAGEDISDVHSVGVLSAKTFQTWATNWTECTNATFGKVLRYSSSNDAFHKETLAVLAAVTEVIKENGGKESETDYFGALMTTLESVEDEQSLAAVMYLLSLSLKRVPASVLKVKFSDVSKKFLELFGKYSNTNTPTLLKSLLKCMAQLLRVQEYSVWSNSSTLHVYNSLLTFVVHSKPKVRQTAQESVNKVLKASSFMLAPNPPPCHPAASATAKYCIQTMEESGGKRESSKTLYILGLLKHVLGHFPQNSLKSSCETILRVMTLSNVIVTSVAMKALKGMFAARPTSSCLPAELNGQIITALYDYQPEENDTKLICLWLDVMEAAHVNLNLLNPKLCSSHLPKFVSSCLKCMQNEKKDIYSSAAHTLNTVIKECIGQSIDLYKSIYESSSSSGNTSTPLHMITQSICSGLGYQYHAAWEDVLRIITVYIEVLGKQCDQLFKKCLQSMCELRESHGFEFKPQLDYAVGMAVTKIGPKQVLDATPLNITGDDDNCDFPRSWLLPVLRNNVKDTQLSYFITYFLPLAAKLRTRSIEFANQNLIVQAKSYDALQTQIWSLLPAFCTRPTDLAQAFPGIAKILGTELTNREDLRKDILASLRKLILKNLDNKENKTVLAKYAKNFLPILFNLYTTEKSEGGRELTAEEDKTRQAVLDTVKAYVQIADIQVIQTFFDRSQALMSEKDISSFKRYALMDLKCAMVVYVDAKRLKKAYKLVTPQLKSTEVTLQKKSYRILETICGSENEVCKNFVKSHLPDLQKHLLESLSTSTSAAKAPRMRCLVHIFNNLEEPNMEFLTAVVSEAVLCIKATGVKARTAADNLLIEMGKAVLKWSSSASSGDNDEEEAVSIMSYFEVVIAGLGGSKHLLSCTLLGLTTIVDEFKDHVNSELLSMLVDNACILLKDKAIEVVQAVLGLLDKIITKFQDVALSPHLELIITSLVSMKEDNRHHFKTKTKVLKVIFDRLIRKFSFKIVQNMVPESHNKWLNHIMKDIEAKKKKRKEKQKDRNQEEESEEEDEAFKHKVQTIDELLKDSDSESEQEEKVDGTSRKGNKKKLLKTNKSSKGAAWLHEKDDEIVDFMDPTVSKKVLGTKPSEAKAQSIKHNFKTAPDGRLIISVDADDDATNDNAKGRKKSKQEDIDDVEDIDDLLEALGGKTAAAKSKKRKLNVEDLEDKDHFSTVSSSYRPGGHGIHRPLDAKKQKTDNIKSGQDYRAKKAGGDIKRKDKPDPYAYIPLEMSNLNKRKKAKTKGQFKNFVKGATKGAKKGLKLKPKIKAK